MPGKKVRKTEVEVVSLPLVSEERGSARENTETASTPSLEDVQAELDELRWAVAALLVIPDLRNAKDDHDYDCVKARLQELIGEIPYTRVGPLKAGADRQDLARSDNRE